MAYGIIKVDNITFDNGGSDQNVTVSGLYRATTSGVTVSGTIAATTVSGVTVIGSTTVSGDTVTGTTANFTSGNFSNIISSTATMSGALIMANQQQVRFREAVGNGVNHIALQAPAIVSADQIITLPDETGTIVTTGDNGSVTSAMILDGTITNADINASAAIADTKLATISTAGKVSGTAITSGKITTNGNLEIINTTPVIQLTESGGTATHSQSYLVRFNDAFQHQTRNSAGTVVSSDYVIAANASGATDHIWRIANTEKARLNSSGLKVVDDLIVTDKIIHDGDTNTAIRFPAADTITFETNNGERARIDSSGRLLVGTSTSASQTVGGGTNTPQIQLAGLDQSTSSLSLVNYFSGGSPANLILGSSTGGAGGTQGIVAVNGDLGRIAFTGSDGSGLIEAAQILAEVDGTPGSNDMPGRLVFSTTSDGSAAPSERMRIDSIGNVSFSDKVRIGALGSGADAAQLRVDGDIPDDGQIYAIGALVTATASTSTETIYGYISDIKPTTTSANTVTSLYRYYARQTTSFGSATVTSQYGFAADSSLTGATNNYGFVSSLSDATGRWNFYASGGAPNFFAGDIRTNAVFTARAVPGNANTSTTATASSLKDGIRTGTPTGNINLTLPTGTDMDSAFQDLINNQSFEWSVINLAAATHVITVVAASGHTVVGNMEVAANSSGRFITRKTAANTFVTYRIA